jgi:hypothetical protein
LYPFRSATMVIGRVAPVTPIHGELGGERTKARTPPVARKAMTSAMISISLALNDHTKVPKYRTGLPARLGKVGNRAIVNMFHTVCGVETTIRR